MTKFVNEKLNVTEAECGLEQASTDAVKALDIVSAGQELATFELDGSDLAIGTDIQSLIDEAVAGVDITSDNQNVCEAAGGTWESGTCTAGSSYNCALGAMCSAFATQYPEDLEFYTNKYTGDTMATSGCTAGAWNAGVRMKTNIFNGDPYTTENQSPGYFANNFVQDACE